MQCSGTPLTHRFRVISNVRRRRLDSVLLELVGHGGFYDDHREDRDKYQATEHASELCPCFYSEILDAPEAAIGETDARTATSPRVWIFNLLPPRCFGVFRVVDFHDAAVVVNAFLEHCVNYF
jgi:hypothetical protein